MRRLYETLEMELICPYCRCCEFEGTAGNGAPLARCRECKTVTAIPDLERGLVMGLTRHEV